MNTCEWLDRAKEENQIHSDYKLAKVLEIHPNRISTYRNTNHQMDDDLAIKVETLLNLPAGTILLDIHAQRTKCSQAAEILSHISKVIGSAAAAVFLSVTTIYHTFAPADVIAKNEAESQSNVYYVKSIIEWIISDIFWISLFFVLFFTFNKIFSYILKSATRDKNTE